MSWCPAFSPASLLFVRAGPGSASFAALPLWPERRGRADAPRRQSFLPRRRAFAGRGLRPRRDARGEAHPCAPPASACETEAATPICVVMSYALVELPPDEITRAPRPPSFGRVQGVFCFFVEPGTPEGFRPVVICRDALITKGTRLVAPCPRPGLPDAAARHGAIFSERLGALAPAPPRRSRTRKLRGRTLYLPRLRQKRHAIAAARADRVAGSRLEGGGALHVCGEDLRPLPRKGRPRRDRIACARVRRAAWRGAPLRGHQKVRDRGRRFLCRDTP